MARQDEIASQYINGKLKNLAQAEVQKDKNIEQFSTLNQERRVAAQSNLIQNESFKKKSDNDNLAQELMGQIKQKQAQT